MSPSLAPGSSDKHFEGERTAILLTLVTLPSRMKNIVQHWLRIKEAQTCARTPDDLFNTCSTALCYPSRPRSQAVVTVQLRFVCGTLKMQENPSTASIPRQMGDAHPSWNLVWRFNPCWILKVVQELHAEVCLFCLVFKTRCSCSVTGTFYMLEWNRRA